ncbi:MAG TPA: sulfotransferase [Steroidobacteraceae bacterium]
MRAGRLDEALPLAERAVAGARCCLPGHGFLASILLQLGRAREAEEVVARAAQLQTGVADAYDGLAYVSMGLGEHERANSLYRRAAELAPQSPRHLYNVACSERSLGRLAEAQAACDRAIALDAAEYPTYLLRSELRVQTPEANHIDELQAQLARTGGDHRAQMFLGYALAKELDDLQHFDEAFHWFAAGAKARRSRLNYDIAADERKLRRIAQVFSRDALSVAKQPAPGGAEASRVQSTPHHVHPAPHDVQSAPHSGQAALDASRCLFIVGLPRSGTTLTERILTGLSGVRSNGETENFSRALMAASAGTGDVFQRAAAADPDAVAAAYVKFAHLDFSGDRIIEKLPMNYLYLGAIHRALPEAKLLLIRRSPLDSCFAMYRTLFGAAYPFTYDFDELARYYAAYDALVNHWRGLLGGELHEIVYEDLVREPQRLGAAAARHCGLTWAAQAVDIQNNGSVSLTASAAQIRRPIFGSSSGRWRHYRRHLAPLIAALRRHGVALPEDA